ncbi:MAG: phosphoribosylglycinamide formyltransferase [candidate division WS1 bacterium]|jgi:phosphoribosylglycinamide formyltransferase-1|nr:phosphoribosylglycinamide formyltransferase [candidate division WS1 bacterium]
MANRIRLGVFASGGGTNFQSIIDACEAGRIDATVAAFITNRKSAGALERAARLGIEAHIVPVGKDLSEEFHAADARHVEILQEAGVELICLAGYMRRIGPEVLRAYEHRVLNIHPALLPSFKGAHGQRDAAEYGVRISGATVHFADADFDRGPIIVQAAVPVLPDDTEETLGPRILEQEHRIYPQAIQWYAEGRLKVEGRRVILEPPSRGSYEQQSGGVIISPPLEE